MATQKINPMQITNPSDSAQLLAGDGTWQAPIKGFTLGVSGKPINGQRLLATAPYAFTVSQSNTKCTALISATGSPVFTLYTGPAASPTTIGTFTFSAGSYTATVSITAGTINAGDVVWIQCPFSADATCADIAFLVRS